VNNCDILIDNRYYTKNDENKLTMSKAFIDRNQQQNSNNNQSETQAKIDPVAQLKWNSQQVDQGWDVPAQMFASEEEEEPVQGKAEEEELMQGKAEEEELQMKGGPVKGGSGTQTGMPDDVRGKMENSFGTDFSNVNIHQNSDKASNMGALAYTQGNDIAFSAGQYQPETSAGQRLLGHELAHVVQQRQGRVKPDAEQKKGMNINSDTSLEIEADVMGEKAAQGKMANVAGKGSGVQKKGDDNDPEKAALLRQFSLNLSKAFSMFCDAAEQVYHNIDGTKNSQVDVIMLLIELATCAIAPEFAALVILGKQVAKTTVKKKINSNEDRAVLNAMCEGYDKLTTEIFKHYNSKEFMDNGSVKELKVVVNRWDEENVSIEQFVSLLTNKINSYHQQIDPIGGKYNHNPTAQNHISGEKGLAWMKMGSQQYLILLHYQVNSGFEGRGPKNSYFYIQSFITEDFKDMALKKHGKNVNTIPVNYVTNTNMLGNIPADAVVQ
jgi:Domain of unknown function (DUF4157)